MSTSDTRLTRRKCDPRLFLRSLSRCAAWKPFYDALQFAVSAPGHLEKPRDMF